MLKSPNLVLVSIKLALYGVRSQPKFMVWILNCSFKFSTSTLVFKLLNSTFLFDLVRCTFSTRQTNFYTLLLFISFDAWWTSTLHLTEMPILHSILTRPISPVTASNFKPNIVYFPPNFWIFVYASMIIGWDKRSLCGDGRRQPIDLLPRLFKLLSLSKYSVA